MFSVKGIEYCCSIIDEVKVVFARKCIWCEEKAKGVLFREKIYKNTGLTKRRYVCKRCASTIKEAREYLNEYDSFNEGC